MMWMRNGRIRLSENCAAITGLETDRSPYSDRFACEPGVEEQPYQCLKSLEMMLHRTSRKTNGWKWGHSLWGWLSQGHYTYMMQL